MRHITNNGLSLIKYFEGFSSNIYFDSAGLATIGYGHLIRPHEQKIFKSPITRTQAENLLKLDVIAAENAVIRLINIPLSNAQFDALVSFVFNLGSGALQRSTLRSKVNREEHHDVPSEFIKWIWAGGKKISGLIKRRQEEAMLYLS